MGMGLESSLGSNIILVFMAILFLAIGLAIAHFKCYWLIAGYNTSSSSEKANIDIEQVGKHMGRMCYIITVINIIGFILGFFFDISISIFIILTVAISIFYVIYIQRFDHNKRSKSEIVAIIVLITTTMLITIIPTFYMGYQKSEVTITKNNTLHIGGMYKTAINMDNITKVSLIDTLPHIVYKNNGFNAGNALKGNFKLENDIQSKLYIENRKKGPFIEILTDKSPIYINYKSSDDTLDLFNKLKNLINE